MTRLLILIATLLFISQNTQAQLNTELGILDLTANGGINPATGTAWKAGDTYRLIFVSSTIRDATSSDISDYNTHVQNAANSAGLGAVNWYAIGSTNTVDARDNSFTTNLDTDGAILLINGSEVVANNLVDLWDGTVDTRIDYDETGNTSSLSTPIWTSWTAVWTGTNNDGTANSSGYLGASNVQIGLAKAELHFWENRSQASNSNNLPFYGISEVLKVSETGGAGIIHVTGDPNENLLLNTISAKEGNLAYHADAQIIYFYNLSGTDYDGITTGTHWIAIDVSSLVDPITSILTPETELTSSNSDGIITLSFESDANLSYVPGTSMLTFTDVDGDATTVNLSDLQTVVQVTNGDASITVTGDGSSDSPYEISLTGAGLIGNDGFVPITDGSGTLTWTKVLENVTMNSDGQIMLTSTNNITPLPLDLSVIPGVTNITTLNSAAAALSPGESGVVRTTNNNTLGMPSTSEVGVLIFIRN